VPPRALIVGDSQAQGSPGNYAERALRAQGLDVLRIAREGKGAVSWTSDESLWREYLAAVRTHRPDHVVFVFGSNDSGPRLGPALLQLREYAGTQSAWLSGPPHYVDPDRERLGASIRSVNAAAFGSRYIDAWPHTPLSLPRDRAGVHLPGESGRPWGEAIAATVLGAAQPSGGRLAKAGSSTSMVVLGAVVLGALGLGVLLARRR
jgi:hypothetical protein